MSDAVFEIWRVIGRKLQFFPIPRVFSTPIGGTISLYFCQELWRLETIIPSDDMRHWLRNHEFNLSTKCRNGVVWGSYGHSRSLEL